jgi:replicative DNA helicase
MNQEFRDYGTECYVLAACLKGPNFWRNIPTAWFNHEITRKAYEEFSEFLKPPYSVYPTANIILDKSEDPEVKLFIKEIEHVDPDLSELRVKLQDMFVMYSRRKLVDVAENIRAGISSSNVGEIVRQNITSLSGLVSPLEAGHRERRWIFEEARERWEYYREMERDPSKVLGIPYNMEGLDKYTNGGLRPGHIVLLFANSGGYKSIFKSNLAYNFAFLEKKDTTVFTLEIDIDDYEHIIDARHSRLSFDKMIRGGLGAEGLDYRSALIDIAKKEYPLRIIDIPDKSTSADVIGEFELHRAQYGKFPDVAIIDYINEMEPLTPWSNTSEKFKNLGVELRRITRSYGVPIIGSMQENREGKKLKDKEKMGTEHIGESHYFQNVCHLVLHLWQDASEYDAGSNNLNVSIKKNRYGPKNKTFSLYINDQWKYVGDREIKTIKFDEPEVKRLT